MLLFRKKTSGKTLPIAVFDDFEAIFFPVGLFAEPLITTLRLQLKY